MNCRIRKIRRRAKKSARKLGGDFDPIEYKRKMKKMAEEDAKKDVADILDPNKDDIVKTI